MKTQFRFSSRQFACEIAHRWSNFPKGWTFAWAWKPFTRDPWKECKKQKSNLLGNSTTDVQFQKRIVHSRNDIEFSHSVVEFPRRLDFCVDHTFHGWHIAAGLDSHSKSLTFWEIRSLQLEETIFNVHTR